MGAISPVNLRLLYNLERQDEKFLIDWCFGMGFLVKDMVCVKCGKPMTLRRKSQTEGYRWFCRKGDSMCSQKTVRTRSWFSGSRLPISEILLLTYMWVERFQSKLIEKELHMGTSTVMEWKRYCREMCKEILMLESQRLGGEGMIVEIEERRYEDTDKYMYSGIERETKNCFFQLYEKRCRLSLLNVITDWVLPGSIIVSNLWEEYNCLYDEDFLQLVEQRKYTINELESTAINIKGSWATIRRGLKKIEPSVYFDDVYAECIWRSKHRPDDNWFVSFMKGATAVFKAWERDNQSAED